MEPGRHHTRGTPGVGTPTPAAGSPATHHQGQQHGGPGRAWEYCHVRAHELVYWTPWGTIEKRIGPDAARGDADGVAAWYGTVAQLGLAGWEMVGVTADPAGGTVCYFKRALPEAPLLPTLGAAARA